MRKVYELKKGSLIKLENGDIIEFEEIRGDKAIFYNEWGIEIEYPDFIDIDEIGELINQKNSDSYNYSSPTLF
ncbi:succinyl-diaminopimelate desuccinylase [Lebetimonas natsushimae]|uniref:succinyl-diaminopimelate desuccinylase n=1 Tax=Lebetimonas natsushimae TaxID=1936991 RepID=UPI000BB8924D|nr:succinyl-diaminopimelate desuccinylase [Lebetimonas natsushimae]